MTTIDADVEMILNEYLCEEIPTISDAVRAMHKTLEEWNPKMVELSKARKRAEKLQQALWTLRRECGWPKADVGDATKGET